MRTKIMSRRLPLGAAVLAATFALAACAGADPAATTSSAAPTPASSVSMDPNYAVTYVGGKAGAADSSLSPVKLGFVNSEDVGPVVFPEARVAAQAAVKYVNTELGGVDGHPLELVPCVIAGNEEQGQACGQQLANQKDVQAVAMGSVIFGNASLFSTLQGSKPVLGSVAAVPADYAAKDAFFLFGDAQNAYGALATFAQEKLKAKTAAIVYPQIPGSDTAAASVQASLEKLGVTVKSVGYPGSNTDLVGPLTAAGASTADVVVPMTDGAGCVRAYQALQQLGLQDKRVLTSNLCASDAVVKQIGGYPKGWSVSIVTNTFDSSDPQVAVFEDKVHQYAGADANLQGSAALGFGMVMTATKIFNSVGADKLSPDTIRTATKQFPGPVFLGPEKLSCGFNSASPALCAKTVQVVTFGGPGEFIDEGTFAAPGA